MSMQEETVTALVIDPKFGPLSEQAAMMQQKRVRTPKRCKRGMATRHRLHAACRATWVR
jgi:hypothetical protein